MVINHGEFGLLAMFNMAILFSPHILNFHKTDRDRYAASSVDTKVMISIYRKIGFITVVSASISLFPASESIHIDQSYKI